MNWGKESAREGGGTEMRPLPYRRGLGYTGGTMPAAQLNGILVAVPRGSAAPTGG